MRLVSGLVAPLGWKVSVVVPEVEHRHRRLQPGDLTAQRLDDVVNLCLSIEPSEPESDRRSSSRLLEVHAAPEDTATSSSPISNCSPFNPSKLT